MTRHFTWDELYAKGTLAEVFERVGFDCPTLRDWLEHDRYDSYWQYLDQDPMYAHVAVPGMHVGGWFDHHIRGTVGAYAGIRDQGASQLARHGQRLLIGPWGHNTLNATGQAHREYGEWDFGAEADLAVLDDERGFLDRCMRDGDNGSRDELPVKVFLMGENRWIRLADWPPPGAVIQEWYLTPGRDSTFPDCDGQLLLKPPVEMAPNEYAYNPRDPVPTLGGPIFWGLSPGGPVDQSPILGRGDVLLYRSEPLARPLAVVGEIAVDLWVTSSAPDTDFIAKLCVVEVSGRVTCLTLGSLRARFRDSWSEPQPLELGVPTRLELKLAPTAYVFPTGSRIALIVTSSDFPRILPHPNTMAPTWTERSPQIATQEILHGGACASCLRLPVLG
jgi:putative CocE/NonD family hydrolase